MEDSERFDVKRRALDKGIFSWHFNVRLKLLRIMGLNGYSLFAFVLGVLAGILIMQLD